MEAKKKGMLSLQRNKKYTLYRTYSGYFTLLHVHYGLDKE